ncbi:diguanylate cyclase [Rehaibacterium terrae]|uniref:diguanylate cyclase n=1 Tax=Rehaibacterium terrae TaxID=1341696 RepID=A0A7W7Y005_9GAMM|nr:diguanylate cyclase [Rehaibacterium terrae]MBB5015596.1 diguanylate cyclase (GGDEF)-like protein [Rehaibacterium terrae]
MPLAFAGLPSTPALSASAGFERVGDPVSVPDGVVTSLAEDHNGLLWIGTMDGLVRFDGVDFQRFRRGEPGVEGLSGNLVRALLVDSRNRLWVGTEADGVSVLDPDTGRFTAMHTGLQPGTASAVRALAEDAEGRIWLGTTGEGLLSVRPDGVVQRLMADDDAGDGLRDDRIAALAAAPDGSLWIGTWQGLARLRPGQERPESVPLVDAAGRAVKADRIRGLSVAPDGSVWVGAQRTGTVRLAPDGRGGWQAERLTEAVLLSALAPSDGTFWLAHVGGIEVFDLATRKLLASHRHRPEDPRSLANAEIRALQQDRAGWVWVGTFGGGLQRSNPLNRALLSRRIDLAADAPLRSLSVVALAAARDGGFWAGVANEDVVRFDTGLRIVERLGPALEQASRLPSALLEDSMGGLWLATDRGLFHRRPGATHLRPVLAERFPEATTTRRLVADDAGGLWIATGDGLFHLDAEDRLRRMQRADSRTAGATVNAIERADGPGEWWVGTSVGLFRLEAGSGLLWPLELRLADGRVPPSRNVLGLGRDGRGGWWIDADGLLRVDVVEGNVVTVDPVSQRLGFGESAFGANLLADARGRIWTQRFVYDPARDAMHRLYPSDGVDIGTGWFRSYARLSDGRFVFGGNEGLLLADPGLFTPDARPPPLVWTRLWVDGEPRPIGATQARLDLPAGFDSLGIAFAGTDLVAGRLVRYRYRLGPEGPWRELAPGQRFIGFGHRAPGGWRLEVEVSDRSGAWQGETRVLYLTVPPLWWQRPVVWGGGVLLLAGLLWGLVRWRTARLLAAREWLEQRVSERTAALSEALAALAEKTQALQEASLTDPLTGLRNRRFLAAEMPAELARNVRLRERVPATEALDLVLLLIDIDRFKEVNDQHGHAAGDAVLVEFARRLRELFRASDLLVRWGGEEFLVVVRDARRDEAPEIAERLRRAVADTPFLLPDGQHLQRTCCIGFLPLPWAGEGNLTWDEAVALADLGLYVAKQCGRDAWVGWEGVPGALPPRPEAGSSWADAVSAAMAQGELRSVCRLPPAVVLAALDRLSELARS